MSDWSSSDWALLTQQQKAASLAADLRAGGMSENAILGILQNVHDESRFDPTSRAYDQPRFSRSDERGYAHGFFQDGAEEWGGYDKWLKDQHPGDSWQNPTHQTNFLIDRLKGTIQIPGGNDYARLNTFGRLNAAKTPGEAASIFVRDYLRPAPGPMARRTAQYAGGGVTDWTGGVDAPSHQGTINGAYGMAPTGDAGVAGPIDTAEAGHVIDPHFKDFQPPPTPAPDGGTAVASAAPPTQGAFGGILGKLASKGVLSGAASAFGGGSDDQAKVAEKAHDELASLAKTNAAGIVDSQQAGQTQLQAVLQRIAEARQKKKQPASLTSAFG